MTAVLSLAQFRDAVVATLQAAIPNVDIATHGGTFDDAELGRFATKAPAIRVAIVGVGKHERFGDGRILLPVNFAAVAVTKDSMADGKKIERDRAGLGLTQAIELTVFGNRFGLEGVKQPSDIHGRNEYSGQLDKTGISLWQVTWTSGLLIGQAGVPEQNGAIGDAIAALSALWINGVDMASGDEILTGFAPVAPAGALPVDFAPDPTQHFPAPAPDVQDDGDAP
jgi:hypothetical protein